LDEQMSGGQTAMNAISVEKPLQRAPVARQNDGATPLFNRVHLFLLSGVAVVQLVWVGLLSYGALLLLH
jgi:hypothetical protein